jgi:hypothetical protein
MGRSSRKRPGGTSFSSQASAGFTVDTDEVANVSDVPGDTASDALDNLQQGETLIELTPNSDVTTVLQSAIDALPSNGRLQIVTPGQFEVSAPLRIVDNIALAGLPASGPLTESPTRLEKSALFYAGPSIIVSEIGSPFPHGAAILDDADYSYQFLNADPDMWIALGLCGCQPENWGELWAEISFETTYTPDANFLFIAIGNSNSGGAPATSPFSLRLVGGANLQAHINIGGVDYTLLTTTGGYNDGNRHMAAIGYDGITVRLFVDGVLEDSEAATGPFSLEPFEVLYLGPGGVQMGRDTWSGCIDFTCGGFYIGNLNKQTGNYAVSWNARVPNAANGDHCQVICDDAHETDDLIKLELDGTGYGWLQTPDPTRGYVGGVSIEDWGSAGGVLGGEFIRLNTAAACKIGRIYANNECALDCYENCYELTVENVKGLGASRYNAFFHSAVCVIRDSEFRGGPIGACFKGGGSIDNVFITDYEIAGAQFMTWGGFVGSLAIGDEGSAGVPEFALMVTGDSGIVFNHLSITCANGAATVPIWIGENSGMLQFLNGIVFPHAGTSYMVEWSTPTTALPIFFGWSGGLAIPLSDQPAKVLTLDGPVAAVALTDADATITAKEGREFKLASTVALSADRVLTLDDALIDSQVAFDGCVLRLVIEPTFAGFSYTVNNHDASELAVIRTATELNVRFSRVTGDWSVISAPAIASIGADPRSIFGANLSGWFDAEQGVTNVGGDASQWVDARGVGLALVQSVSGQRPLITTGLNGRKLLRFTRGNLDRLSVASGAPAQTADHSIFLFGVLNQLNLGSHAGMCAIGDGTTSSGLGIDPDTNPWYGGASLVNPVGAETLVVSTGYHFAKVVDGNTQGYLDGVASGASTANVYGASTAFHVGGYDGSAAGTSVDVYEIVLVDAAATAGQIAAMQAYFAAKYQ